MKGDAELGVPPLHWADGDHIGNIRRLIDVDLKALDNASYDDAIFSFDLSTGRFRYPDGTEVSSADVEAVASGGASSRALAGRRTLARAAVWRALLREEGSNGQGERGRDGLLADLAGLANDRPSAVTAHFSRKPTHTPQQAEVLAQAIGTTGQGEPGAG